MRRFRIKEVLFGLGLLSFVLTSCIPFTAPDYATPVLQIDSLQLELDTGLPIYTHMETDAVGNIYLAGISHVFPQSSTSGVRNVVLSKFDATGQLLWHKLIHSYAIHISIFLFFTSHADDISSLHGIPITSLALNNDELILVIPAQDPNSANTNWLISKVDAMGNLIWQEEQGTVGGGNDVPYHLVVGENGEFFITGVNKSNNTINFVTVAYDATGAQLWTKTNEVFSNSETLYAPHVRSYYRNGELYLHYYYYGPSSVDPVNTPPGFTKVLVTYDRLGSKVVEQRTTQDKPPKMFAEFYHSNQHRNAQRFSVDDLGSIYEFSDRLDQTWLQKSSGNGTLLWEVNFLDQSTGVETPPVWGHISEVGEAVVLTKPDSVPNNSIMLSKFDVSGNQLFSKQINFRKLPSFNSYEITSDGFGKIYIHNNVAWEDHYRVAQDTDGRIFITRTVIISDANYSPIYFRDRAWDEIIVLDTSGTEIVTLNARFPDSGEALSSLQNIGINPLSGNIYLGSGALLEKYNLNE